MLNKIRYVDCDVQVLYSDDGGGDGGSNNIGILFSAVFLNVCVFVLWICNSTPFYSTFILNNAFGNFSSIFFPSLRLAIAFIRIRLCF